MTKPKTTSAYGVRPATKRVGIAVSRPIYYFQLQLEAILAEQSASVY